MRLRPGSLADSVPKVTTADAAAGPPLVTLAFALLFLFRATTLLFFFPTTTVGLVESFPFLLFLVETAIFN